MIKWNDVSSNQSDHQIKSTWFTVIHSFKLQRITVQIVLQNIYIPYFPKIINIFVFKIQKKMIIIYTNIEWQRILSYDKHIVEHSTKIIAIGNELKFSLGGGTLNNIFVFL